MMDCACFYFSDPFVFFELFVLLPQSRSSYPGSLHRRGASPRSSLRYVLLRVHREDSALSSLVDSRRIVPTRAVIGALVDSWYNFLSHTTPYGYSKPQHQRRGCSRLPLDHRGARIGVCLKEHKITVLDGLHRLYEGTPQGR